MLSRHVPVVELVAHIGIAAVAAIVEEFDKTWRLSRGLAGSLGSSKLGRRV
ncbi:MAG: hypothetical protein VX346_22195 [Planctomycetota bacterium]|nr:hypothetical protein [Planctomycetota bacterium]